MLAAYTGTYQSISPMPSPMLGPSMYSGGGAPSDFSLDSGADDSYHTHSHSYSISSSFTPPIPSIGSFNMSGGIQISASLPPYDPSKDAKKLLNALTAARPDLEALIDVLPRLSGDEVLALRQEYKRIYKNVNIVKHIKKLIPGAVGKVMWVTALGPYESEGWWANTWYQKSITKDDILIEALMGKTLAEIREIKRGFRDAKYNHDLVVALEAELPADKFRYAILLSLDEDARMPDDQRVDMGAVERDVRRLYQVLEEGAPGKMETKIIDVVVKANADHLREVIRWYKHQHGKDVSKLVIRHSKNLVGESLLHVLAGIIDKALRDAKLIQNALESFVAKEDLLISRLVRVHWDREHMVQVREAYKRKYRKELRDVLMGALSGGLGEFVGEMYRV
ncbi:Annexin [Ascobolus immersus RN42]|uniref:Annexin n=1 Tax=Ascobolus immersus RN42 TaxID=1160509 RepID=A0A3N4HTP6_ASCIM|nr:Annexin [Ascobolus immersus RN42]